MIKTGKTYKIISIHTDKIYIGSTKQTLSTRLREHVYDYNRFLLGNFGKVMSFEILKLGDYQIELLEDHGQITKLELLKFEKAAMLLYRVMIVNKNIPSGLGSEKEYRAERYLKNKDKIQEYGAEYRVKNKEKIHEQDAKYRAKNKEKINEKFTCDVCDGKYTYATKSNHFKTQKHSKACSLAAAI